METTRVRSSSGGAVASPDTSWRDLYRHRLHSLLYTRSDLVDRGRLETLQAWLEKVEV